MVVILLGRTASCKVRGEVARANCAYDEFAARSSKVREHMTVVLLTNVPPDRLYRVRLDRSGSQRKHSRHDEQVACRIIKYRAPESKELGIDSKVAPSLTTSPELKGRLRLSFDNAVVHTSQAAVPDTLSSVRNGILAGAWAATAMAQQKGRRDRLDRATRERSASEEQHMNVGVCA